uniref:Ingression protein 1 n=1 Tax=Ogataea thermomethanolica (nom. inval.) TaxID=310468 RepID=A0A5P8D122_9ASCO|nr:ingression protein 1 [Ogataea thermomethanolica (nom. inval.)]QGW56830.1 hypothetical protein [Ogataea thermomethanolica (nom. inval.)]
MDTSFWSSAQGHSKASQPDNQLVVIVSKAHNLPNKKKLDKQSPYCVARIQDQVQRTKVVHRGGQNPRFDDELWFSLDSVEETTLTLFVYHQLKKDSELVCKAEIDFTPALRRSSKDGYDNWFLLSYNGKPAGKIYLEMTYYCSSRIVPPLIDTLQNKSNINNHEKFHNRSSILENSEDGLLQYKTLCSDSEANASQQAPTLPTNSGQNPLQKLISNAWKISSAFNKTVGWQEMIDSTKSTSTDDSSKHILFNDSSDEEENVEHQIGCAEHTQMQQFSMLGDNQMHSEGPNSLIPNLIFGYNGKVNDPSSSGEKKGSCFSRQSFKDGVPNNRFSEKEPTIKSAYAPLPPQHRIPLTPSNFPANLLTPNKVNALDGGCQKKQAPKEVDPDLRYNSSSLSYSQIRRKLHQKLSSA